MFARLRQAARLVRWHCGGKQVKYLRAMPALPMPDDSVLMPYYSDGAVQAIINSFGVYGIGHLLEAAIVWLVLFRYRSLIPLVYAFVLCGNLLGVALLAAKPLPVVPPGQVGIYVLLPLTALFFLLSIRKPAATSDVTGATASAAQETQA